MCCDRRRPSAPPFADPPVARTPTWAPHRAFAPRTTARHTEALCTRERRASAPSACARACPRPERAGPEVGSHGSRLPAAHRLFSVTTKCGALGWCAQPQPVRERAPSVRARVAREGGAERGVPSGPRVGSHGVRGGVPWVPTPGGAHSTAPSGSRWRRADSKPQPVRGARGRNASAASATTDEQPARRGGGSGARQLPGIDRARRRARRAPPPGAPGGSARRSARLAPRQPA